jgi:hypothetical protein
MAVGDRWKRRGGAPARAGASYDDYLVAVGARVDQLLAGKGSFTVADAAALDEAAIEIGQLHAQLDSIVARMRPAFERRQIEYKRLCVSNERTSPDAPWASDEFATEGPGIDFETALYALCSEETDAMITEVDMALGIDPRSI